MISRGEKFEKTCMLKLRVVDSYCSNYQLRDEYKENDTYVLVFNKFPPVITSGFLAVLFTKQILFPSPGEFLIKLNCHLSPNLSESCNFLRIYLLTMNKHHHNRNLPVVQKFIKVSILVMNKCNHKNMALFLQDNLYSNLTSIFIYFQ